jgi:hypothetical protein
MAANLTPTTPALPNAAPLQQLRDIHIPAAVSWWPPAPGWWLLLIVAVASLAAALFWLRNYRRKNRYRRLALQHLQTLRGQWQQQRDDNALTQAINRLLKQTALAAYPRQRVAALTGADWLLFLDSGLKQPRFSEPALRALASTYQAAPPTISASALFDASEYWIRRHRC